jgi:hypothetical protein
MSSDARPRRQLLERLRRRLAGSGRALGFMLIIGGTSVVWQKFSNPYGLFEPTRLLVAAGLIGGGVLLFKDDPTARGTTVVARERTGEKAPRARSPLTLFTLAAASIAVGIGIILGNLSVITLSVGQLSALSLMVVGGGLLVAAWWGRARWLIAVALLLIPVVLATSYIDMPPRGSVGSVHLRPRSESDIARRYNLLFGNITLDLTGLRPLTGTASTNINVAAGNVTVYVPERVNLRVAGHIEWGNHTVGRGYQAGEDLSFSQTFEGKKGAGTLDLDVNGGITSLYVERISRRERRGGLHHRDRHGRQAQRRRQERADRGDARRDGRDARRDGRNDEGGSGRAGRRNERPGDRHGRRSGRG